MDKDQKVAYIQAQSVCALAELEMMKAQNHWCDQYDHIPRQYDADDFERIPEKYGLHHNQILTLFGE